MTSFEAHWVFMCFALAVSTFAMGEIAAVITDRPRDSVPWSLCAISLVVAALTWPV